MGRQQNIKSVRPELLRNQMFRPFFFQGGIKLKNYEIKKAFKNLPDVGRPDNETVACHEYRQCEGCNYLRRAYPQTAAGMILRKAAL